MRTDDLLANGRDYLCYVGMETDLIFTQGIDLPGFASFPLLETKEGRDLLRGYIAAQIEAARRAGFGAVIETPTWIANPDRAAQIGYRSDQIAGINAHAVEFTRACCEEAGNVPVVLSCNIGPRDDAYAPSEQMTVETARKYHMLQVQAAAQAGADVASAFTIAYSNEAAGIVRAAGECGIPAVVSFTVETDGRLPSGETFGDAVACVDALSDGYPAYYLINCAHPDHLSQLFDGLEPDDRLAGLVVNASRCSHAELDESEELDDGDPAELGAQMGRFASDNPHFRVFGGCCGTDQRHMREIAANVRRARGRS